MIFVKNEFLPQSLHFYPVLAFLPRFCFKFCYTWFYFLRQIRAHPERYFRTDIAPRVFACWNWTTKTPEKGIVQLLLTRLFNNLWHNYSTAADTIFQQSLALLFNSHWYECSTVTGTIVQQSLARMFNSHWYNCLAVASTIVQQALARFFNSRVAGWFFNSHWHDFSTVTDKFFSFFYAGRILQQWCSLLKNRTIYHEYDIWFQDIPLLQYINLVLDHIFSLVILFIVNSIMKSSITELKKMQYNASLAITSAIRKTSQTKIYRELGVAFLKSRWWLRRHCMFYKIKTLQLPNYLYSMIPSHHHHYNTRNGDCVETNYCGTNAFKYSFFPDAISEWNKLDLELQNAKSYSLFRKSLPKFGRPSPYL